MYSFFIEINNKLCYNKKENIRKEINQKMEKIYNNLNIENLMKTEWFNQFDAFQQKEIRYGLEEGLDVSVYATPEFDWEQMNSIRFGLIVNLDVSIYAKEEFDKYQMFYIREGLRENLDVSKYAKPEYTWQEMKVIRDELLNKRKINKKTMRE